jgi:hypothetical protein
VGLLLGACCVVYFVSRLLACRFFLTQAADYPHILVEFDHNANCNFFHNTQTAQKGWDLASVYVPVAGADDIEQRLDPKTNMPYFFNKVTGQSGWSREAVMPQAVREIQTHIKKNERCGWLTLQFILLFLICISTKGGRGSGRGGF